MRTRVTAGDNWGQPTGEHAHSSHSWGQLGTADSQQAKPRRELASIVSASPRSPPTHTGRGTTCDDVWGLPMATSPTVCPSPPGLPMATVQPFARVHPACQWSPVQQFARVHPASPTPLGLPEITQLASRRPACLSPPGLRSPHPAGC
eukprot:364170-Chlamydomonas_euryale.AAC.12